MINKKFWMSLGTALAATRAVQTVSHITADDVLGVVGLARRRNTAVGNIALLGLGALIGAGTALLLAPTDGQEARKRVADNLGKARDKGLQLVNDAKERAPEIGEYAKNKVRDFEERSVPQQHS
jgi:YtxH-like protein